MLPIASNHIPRRTCEFIPSRIKDHERILLASFHKDYHKIYSPEIKELKAPKTKLSTATEKQIRNFTRRNLKPPDLAHSMEHINCVVKLAKFLSEKEGASSKITVPAAYLHDIAPREATMYHMHTFKSIIRAKQFLSKIPAFTEEEILQIQHCILTSSYGSYLLGYNPFSLEAKIVRDADWLEAIGARGIARVFAFAQAHGAKKFGYPESDPEGFPIMIDMNITGPDQTPIYHFFTKLLKLYPLLQTETAKKLGQERQKIMIEFLNQYRKEMDINKKNLKRHQQELKFSF
jgi:uncharacterized protein